MLRRRREVIPAAPHSRLSCSPGFDRGRRSLAFLAQRHKMPGRRRDSERESGSANTTLSQVSGVVGKQGRNCQSRRAPAKYGDNLQLAIGLLAHQHFQVASARDGGGHRTNGPASGANPGGNEADAIDTEFEVSSS